MTGSKKPLSMVLALLIGVGAISGCSQTPPAGVPSIPQQNNQVSTPVTSPAGNTATQQPVTSPAGNTGTQQPVTSSPNKNTSVSATTEAKNALIDYLNDEMIFTDSESLDENSFATKSTDVEAEGEITATEVTKKPPMRRNLQNRPALTRKIRKENMLNKLTEAGAVTKDENGKITVDPAKVREFMKNRVTELRAAAQQKKMELKARFDNLPPEAKEKLKNRAEIAKEKIAKLKSKGNKIFASDVVEVTNPDGTITRTRSMEFEHVKFEFKRENKISRTYSADDKLLKIEHYMTMTAKNFSREVTRTMTLNEDGSRKIVVSSVMTWSDGRKRELHEERNINADGTGSGTGTLTITDKNGETKTFNLSSERTEEGTLSTSATDETTNTEVSVEEGEDGEATATVTEDGKEETTEVDIEEEADSEE